MELFNQLILECIENWALNYPIVNNNNSLFDKCYKKLQNDKHIKFPMKKLFFGYYKKNLIKK